MGYEQLYEALRKDADERSDYLQQMNNALTELEMRSNRSDPVWESTYDADVNWQAEPSASEFSNEESMTS